MMRTSLVILGSVLTIGCGHETSPWQPSPVQPPAVHCHSRQRTPTTRVLECEPIRYDVQPIGGPGGNIVWGT